MAKKICSIVKETKDDGQWFRAVVKEHTPTVQVVVKTTDWTRSWAKAFRRAELWANKRENNYTVVYSD